MPWTCKRCLHENFDLPDDESTSLLVDDEGQRRNLFTCEACGHRSKNPEKESYSEFFSRPSGPPFLGIVDEALAKFSPEQHLVSDDNVVEILDTPHLWGTPFDEVKSSIKLAQDRLGLLVDKMKEIISSGRQVIDIVSLGVPDNDDIFEKAIIAGIDDATRGSLGNVVIRLLFGYVPTRDGFETWRERLLTKLKSCLIGQMAPRLFYGQLATTTNPMKVVVSEQYWNHAKIVAADGIIAIVGGHNFAESAYAAYPMAHDISVRVIGGAAAGTQAFCDYLWNYNTLGASSCYRLVQDTPKLASSLRWEKFAPKKNSFACFSSRSSSLDQSTIIRPVRVDSTQTTGKSSNAIPKTHSFDVTGCKTARILTLGRGFDGDRASDVGKLQLIRCAQKIIRLCQQDVVFLGKFAFSEEQHEICMALAKAMMANQDLKVQIVVSPPRGWAGGDPYSWGAGAKGTYELIAKFVKKFVPKTASTILTNLYVAPFCFTKVKFLNEMEYLWPNIGAVAKPFPTGNSCIPMPGNHSKVFFIDDTVCYVGSDNLYPNQNVEFGYLIEGEAVAALIENYWSEIWWHSAAHCYQPPTTD